MKDRQLNETTRFSAISKDSVNEARDIILSVTDSLLQKGYNPVNQIVGYILSGDPTYITSFNNARILVRRLERDELLEELVKFYLDNHNID
ncbi:MAG: IreB family regulatory phosphoprotein [Firmicutes bacterium]|nr:IreB family regulatory phosphoprotein [Bacillota bacterium]